MDDPAPLPQPTFLDDVEGTTEVILVRHARSADYIPGTGHSTNLELHPEGERQLGAIAARLAPKHLDAVYASHLHRAVQTAEAIAAPHGLPVTQFEELAEVKAGDWAQHGEFRRRAVLRDPEWMEWRKSCRWVAARHPGGTIVIVSHGGAINAYLAEVLGTERSLWLLVDNTSVTIVRVGELGHTVVVAGDTYHLYDPVLGRPETRQ
jgi:broad specificity phosphatase PhoE